MENITLEQIDLIMKRANVTYAEAKEALEECGGDAVEALIFLEKQNKINQSQSGSQSYGSSLCDGAKSVLKKLNATRFVLRKDTQNIIDLPLSIALVIMILCCHISIAALIISYLCGCRIRIIGENDAAENLSAGMDFVKH